MRFATLVALSYLILPYHVTLGGHVLCQGLEVEGRHSLAQCTQGQLAIVVVACRYMLSQDL